MTQTHEPPENSGRFKSRCGLLGKARLDYPANHIEADNRLSWFLGRLDTAYGSEAFYVHMFRDPNETAQSFVKRYSFGIINAYRSEILMHLSKDTPAHQVCLDYVDTVNTNIALFLKDKENQMKFSLGNAEHDFAELWEWIGAEGDFNAAIREFEVAHNASEYLNVSTSATCRPQRRKLRNLIGRIKLGSSR